MKKLDPDKLRYAIDCARENLKNMGRGARLIGMERDLTEGERLAVAWLIAAMDVDITEIVLDYPETSSVWDPG